MSRLLDNIVWHTLSGAHTCFSAGTGAARRYAAGFPPIVAFKDQFAPDLSALAPFCAPGELFYTDGWAGPAPTGWEIVFESTMLKMILDDSTVAVEDAADATRLVAEHAPQAVELAALARPGPFGARTIELGEYYGYFDGDRLIAMAGERFHAGSLREISGVCTHPDFQGRGLARKLLTRLITREQQRGETPVLHVMADNVNARRLYVRLGFRDYMESVVRVISRR